MVITNYSVTQDNIEKMQSLKGKTKLKVNQNISNCYDEMNYRIQSNTFQFEEDLSSETQEGIS